MSERPAVTFGVMVPWLIGMRESLDLCIQAERLGFHSIWSGDHLIWYVPFPDPVAMLAAASAVTTRVRLGTGVMLSALRPPVLLAKQLATLDWMSGGRLIAGMGIGGENPAEFRAAGIPLEQRSRRLDETIEACRLLWQGQPVEYHGRHLDFEATPMDLVPVQSPPPIWIGGRQAGSLRRAGRLGDGWLAFVVTPERYAESLRQVEAHAVEAGRDPALLSRGLLVWSQLDHDRAAAREAIAPVMEATYRTPFGKFERYCVYGTPDDWVSRLSAFIDAGVRHFNLSFSWGDRAAQMRTFVEEVLPRLPIAA